MEGIFIIIGLIIAWNILVSFFRNSGGNGNSPEGYTTPPSEQFKIKVTNSEINGDGFNWDVFKVEMRGYQLKAFHKSHH